MAVQKLKFEKTGRVEKLDLKKPGTQSASPAVAQIAGQITEHEARTMENLARAQAAKEQQVQGVNRAKKIVGGAARQYAGSMVNAAGTAMAGLAAIRPEEESARVSQRRRKNAKLQRIRNPVSQYTDELAEGLTQKADELTERGSRDIQAAKLGLGSVGQTMVDVGVAGVQLGGDIALNAATAGLGTAAMLTREFGSSAQEARMDGASLGEQIVYGAAKAAAAKQMEKLSNVAAPFAKAYGKGFADDMTEEIIKKATARMARTAAGKTALGAVMKTAMSGGGEALEEMGEYLLAPVLQLIYQADSKESAWENLKRTYGENFDPAEMLYSGLVGGIVGAAGGTVDVATGAKDTMQGYKNDMTSQAVDNAYDVMGREGMFSGKARQAVRQAEDIMPRLYQGVTEAQLDSIMPKLTDTQQDMGMEDKAFRSKSVPDHLGAVALLQKNMGEISGMQPVAEVTGQEIPKTGMATERVMTFLNNIGGKVNRPGLGDVLFSRSKVKNSLLGHGFGEAKVELMAGVPGVIEHGKQIGFTENWKGRGYDSYVFAAPVQYRGEPVYVTAIVIRDSANRYYLHEAVDQNGNMIFGQSKSPDTASDGPAVKPQDTVAGSELSGNSVAQNAGQNNGKFAETDMYQEPAEPKGKEPTVEELLDRAQAQPPKVTPVKARSRNENAMTTLGIDPSGDLGDYTGVEFLVGAEEGRKKTQKARRQAEARLQPSKGEKAFAKGIAEGDYTVDDIPASMDRERVRELADYYTAEKSYKGVDGVFERGREIRRTTEDLAATYFEDSDAFRPIKMLVMNERTPERVMRSIFGDKRGEQINQAYIYPVQQNEAKKVRFIQRQLDDMRYFQDSSGRQSQLTREERMLVQQVMEDRFVGESVASMEMAEGIRSAADNIRNGEDATDAAREFSLNAEEKALAQQLARWTANQELLASGRFDSVKIQNAVEKFSKRYDLFYDAVNDFLTAHGYSTIGFIKGYAPHMQGVDTQNKLLSALRSMGVNADASSLPTSISGMTADFKPGKRWNPFFQQRLGDQTDYDVYKGFESYVSYLGDIFYHTDDIARLRGVSRYLRKTYGPEEINNAIDHAESLRNADLDTQTAVLRDAGKISEGTELTYQDARRMMDGYIDELYDNVTKTTKYGELVKYIENYANILAGKQSMADRGLEYTAGRTSLNAGNKLVAAFGRAQVAGNLSSVLNQSAQLSQILAEVDGKYVAKAAADLTKSTGGKLWNIKKTELFNQSDLLTGKKGIEYLTADDSRWDKLVTAMFKPADMMDSMVSALAVQSKYNQLVAEGKPSEVAMLEADRWATSVMASRMKGSRPLALESKSLVNQMLHMFQVEAMNSWGHVSFDMPRQYKQIAREHGKKAGARAAAAVVTKGLLSAFLLNRVSEAVYGGTPAPFDLLGYLTNFVSSGLGMTSNEWLKTLLNSGWEELTGEPLFEEEEKEQKNFNWGEAAKETLQNVSNDIPFIRNVSGLLGLGDQSMPFANMAEAAQGLGRAVKDEDRSAAEIGMAALELGSTLLPGGRQLQKTAQGAYTMAKGGRMYGYGDNERLQYPVESTPTNWAQALAFGNSGLDETREYYASGESGLTARQTGLLRLMVTEGAAQQDVYDAIQDIRKQEGNREKLLALENTDLTDRQKWQLFNGMIATKGSQKAEDFRQMLTEGMSWQQISEAYREYLRLSDEEQMNAVEKATRFAQWADDSGMNEKQRSMVKDKLVFYNMSPAEATRYTELTEAGLGISQAARITEKIGQLKPVNGASSVSNVQRYRAVLGAGLTEREQLTALESMMEDMEFEKLETAYNAGVSLSQYVTFRERTYGLTADKDANGKTISGSKKAKVMEAIDAMNLTSSQKTALYYAAGYKESTLDDAPWINGTGRTDAGVQKLGEDALNRLRLGGTANQIDRVQPLSADALNRMRQNAKNSDDIMPKLR